MIISICSAAYRCLVLGVRDLELWPRDCADIRKVGQNVSDVYQVSSLGPGLIPNEISVYCDMNSSEASWLVSNKKTALFTNFQCTFTSISACKFRP